MSHTQDSITGAIARSISHNEIVTVRVDDIDAAYADIAVDAEDYVDVPHGGADGETLREVWGRDEDGNDWRVHLLESSVRCGCGEWIGEACQWSGPRNETVLVEYMPRQHRASHSVANNHGIYPHNGAVRVRVEKSCAELLLDDEGEQEWSRIV